MDVIVDGVPYVRVDSVSHNKIGIAITTHNRPQVLANSLEQHRKHLPPGAVVFVIDDGSNPPAKVPEWCNLIRHDKSRGIVASKNSSLECLMDSG
ncbi:TPA: glycosyltransferase family 2 protein, partial [Enterobacter kobei]